MFCIANKTALNSRQQTPGRHCARKKVPPRLRAGAIEIAVHVAWINSGLRNRDFPLHLRRESNSLEIVS